MIFWMKLKNSDLRVMGGRCTVLLSPYDIIEKGIITNGTYLAQTIDNERNSNF